MSLPHRLGRLRRISRIGSGGFATVWLYSDPDLQSRVAVKALADNWSARTDIRDRFLEEARILRRADSDNIVRVYDLGETEDGTPYFVMNYADRGTVADMLNAPSRSLASIADLVGQASTGLKRLHSMGILHRDVKPQNLLLSSDHSGGTRLVVADLGVAKAMLHASGITQVVGTPAYMAPEQADPTSAVDARCDVHALGAVAYHMLTGQPMRTGGMESLFSTDPIPPPSTLVPDLPASIDSVLLRAVANDPEQRWADIAAFGTAFTEAATNTPNRMYVPPRVEADVWQPQPVPSGGSPAAPQSSPISPVPPVSPVPPPGQRGGVAPDRRTSNRRTGVLTGIAAVVLVALALGGALLVESVRSDEGSSAPELSLGDGWSAPSSDGELQWTYANGSEDLELVVNTASSTEESVQDAAEDDMASLEDDGFEQQQNSALDPARHGRWEKGWGLEYTGDGGDTYYWRWYFGNSSPATAGWVEIHGPRDAVEGDQQAEELLETARDEAIIGE